jgi:hypothetical protein
MKLGNSMGLHFMMYFFKHMCRISIVVDFLLWFFEGRDTRIMRNVQILARKRVTLILSFFC